ncbi:hypothetical protein [Sphingobium chungbukense]|uniref:hypothetical protein n=1 Tax=Sphingobium chungbukense TaxID=56193 RepID=UPI00069A1594|nr:hypothetical protein [Sphingobium chungbukense]
MQPILSADSSTTIDLFDRFDAWASALTDRDLHAWRDALPTAVVEPQIATEHPTLIRALDRVRQLARIDGTALPWLGLPFALRDTGLSAVPLPCLVGGAKAFRLKRKPDGSDWLATVRSIEEAARTGLERLHDVERFHRDAQRAIVAEFRPGALPALLALAIHLPLLSPRAVSAHLEITVAGASKLMERTASAGLLIEITQRRSWRLFLPPDLAIEFGYSPTKRGRPAREAPPLPVNRALADVFADFDEQMAHIDRLLDQR